MERVTWRLRDGTTDTLLEWVILPFLIIELLFSSLIKIPLMSFAEVIMGRYTVIERVYRKSRGPWSVEIFKLYKIVFYLCRQDISFGNMRSATVTFIHCVLFYNRWWSIHCEILIFHEAQLTKCQTWNIFMRVNWRRLELHTSK